MTCLSDACNHLHSWLRDPNPLFYKDPPLYCLPPFFKFCPPPHSYKYIFTPPVMCSQQLSLLYWKNNSLISKMYFWQCHFFFKSYSLVKVIYLLIRCYKTRFFLWNTDKTDRNGVNKQNSHTKHSEKDSTGKGYRNKWYPPFFKQPI